MQLYILGKNSDDKGTQLEQLTVRILEYQGLDNIQTNIQGAGGNEIDITAYKKSVVGIKPQNFKVIGECKAYKNPIDTTDWLKFIGKIHYAKEDNPHTVGIMVCLSGANGAVVGMYNERHENDETIQLIANGDLIKLISECFNVEAEIKVRERLVAMSYADIYEINLLYYEKRIYWAISFIDGKYTISYANGEPIIKEDLETIFSIIDKYSPYLPENFIDIREYIKVQQHLTAINMILLTILVNGFLGKLEDVAIQIQDIRKHDKVDTNVLKMAIAQNPFVQYNGDEDFVKLKNEDDIDIMEFYRYVIYSGCPVELITSSFYQTHINEDLLKKIQEIQFGLEIPDDKKDDCLFIIKCSPSALLRALTPYKLFQGFEVTKNQENMRNMYINIFMKMLIDGFIESFQNQALFDTYFHFFKFTNMKVLSDIEIIVDENKKIFKTCLDYGLFKLQGMNQATLVVKA